MPKPACNICKKKVDQYQGLICPSCKKPTCLNCTKQCKCSAPMCKTCMDNSAACETCAGGRVAIVNYVPC